MYYLKEYVNHSLSVMIII